MIGRCISALVPNVMRRRSPDECFAMILENMAHEEWTDAAENAENLRDWMMKGGIPPGGGKLRKTSIYSLLRWLLAHSKRDT